MSSAYEQAASFVVKQTKRAEHAGSHQHATSAEGGGSGGGPRPGAGPATPAASCGLCGTA